MKKVQRMLNFHTYKRLFCANCDVIALPNVVYTSKDKMIQIGKFQTFEEAIDFQNKTNITCCFCDKEKAWIMYNVKQEPVTCFIHPQRPTSPTASGLPNNKFRTNCHFFPYLFPCYLFFYYLCHCKKPTFVDK